MEAEPPKNKGGRPKKRKPAVPPRRRVDYEIAKAILVVHERKKMSHYCGYKEIAEAHKLPIGTLKSAYCRWLKGEIDLGVVEASPGELKMDQRLQHSKTLELVNRHLSVLLKHYEQAIETEENRARGRLNKLRPLSQKGQLVFLSRELLKLIGMRTVTEKGYDSFLAAIEEARTLREKPVAQNPEHPAPIDVQMSITNANDEQRALEALRGNGQSNGNGHSTSSDATEAGS